MAVYRRTARSRFTLLLLVLTSITLLTLDYRGTGAGMIDSAKDGARDLFAPVQDASDRVFAPVGNLVGGVLHHGDLRTENVRLRRENDNLRGQLLRSADTERERDALLDIGGLESAQDVPRVEARVVSVAPSNTELTIQIDKGSDAGVAVRMPIVTGAGLVGRVSEVSRRRATVVLLTDKTFSVGVRLASGDVGVANGTGSRSTLTVDLIDPATTVDPNEVVVTSGLQQSQYPPGIPVGRIRRAVAPRNALQQDVDISPVVDLRRLAFVTVLQWSPR